MARTSFAAGSPIRANILVVDDRLEMAEMVADTLEEHGYLAKPVSSSRLALAMLASSEFDALITDLRMPEVDGIGLLDASRSHDPHRPVIVMTGYGGVESAIESMRRGAFHYLTKPFKNEELLRSLGRALEHARLPRR